MIDERLQPSGCTELHESGSAAPNGQSDNADEFLRAIHREERTGFVADLHSRAHSASTHSFVKPCMMARALDPSLEFFRAFLEFNAQHFRALLDVPRESRDV